MNSWYLAFSQIKHNPFRSILMGMGVAIAAATMTAVALLMVGVNQSITNTALRLGADVMVVPAGENIARQYNEALITGTSATFYFDSTTIEKISGVQGIEQISTQIFVETLTNARCCAGKFFVVGFDPQTDFTVIPWLKDDHALSLDDKQNRMIVGDRILLRKGDTAQFFGTSFTVAGVLEPTGTGMDWTIYISEKSLRTMVTNSDTKAQMPLRIREGDVSTLLVKTESGVDLIDLAERIEQTAPQIQAVLSSTVAKLARQQLFAIACVLACVVVGLWVMALILSGVIFSMAVRERRSQIGLLVAKGANKRFIFGMLTQESIMIAATSCLSGCFMGLLIVISFRELLSNALGASDVLPDAAVTGLFVAAFSTFGTATAVMTAILPVMLILRTEPHEAIKQGRTT